MVRISQEQKRMHVGGCVGFVVVGDKCKKGVRRMCRGCHIATTNNGKKTRE